MGAQLGGARWDDWRTGCPFPNVSTGGAAPLPMCQLAWRSGCSEAVRTLTSGGASAADVPPSKATGAAVEPLRALQTVFNGPASGVAGDRGGDLAGRREQRAALPGQVVKRASFARSAKESKPAIHGHGKGRY